jgi:hypothetical protein
VAIPFTVRDDADPGYDRVLLALALQDKEVQGRIRYAVLDREKDFIVEPASSPSLSIFAESQLMQFILLNPLFSASFLIAVPSLAVYGLMVRRTRRELARIYRNKLQDVLNYLRENDVLNFAFKDTGYAPQLPDGILTTVAGMLTKASLSTSAPARNYFGKIKKRILAHVVASVGTSEFDNLYQVGDSLQEEIVRRVFEDFRDNVKTSPEFEELKWPWETLEDGGDCDCKTTLLAACLLSIGAYVRICVIPPLITESEPVQPHSFLRVALFDSPNRKEHWIILDTSEKESNVNEISTAYSSYLGQTVEVDLNDIATKVIKIQKL